LKKDVAIRKHEYFTTNPFEERGDDANHLAMTKCIHKDMASSWKELHEEK